MSSTARGRGMADVTRDVGLRAAVVATVVVTAVALAVPGAAAEWVRAASWATLGAALLVQAGNRPESTSALRILGLGAILLGTGWALVAADTGGTYLVDVRLQLLVPGVTGIGVASLVVTPTWRYRAPLLDGVVLAVAGAAIVLVVAGGVMDSMTWVAAYALAFSALLGPAVLLASTRRHHLRPAPATMLAAGSFVALGVAGLGTAVAALRGVDLPVMVGVAWVVAPGLGLVTVLRPAPTYGDVVADEAGRPAPVRLLALTAIGFVPALVTATVAPHALVPGLVVSLFATVLVAARVTVSARFDVEDARAAADVRFDALVEHAAEVLALLDDDGNIFYVSRAVEETFDMPAGDVLGRSPVDLAHPDDVESVQQALEQVPERPGVPVHTRLRLLDGAGNARHAEATIVDLRHIGGVGAISLTVRDVTERVSLEAELVRRARTDSLTGLVTRTVLTNRVDHVLTARRPNAALLFIDLDDFKLVNDGFGHVAGDDVLVVLAERLRDLVRDHDTAGRVGGDEFAILLEELDGGAVERATEIARRLIEVGRRSIDIEGEPVEIGMSVGIAMAEPGMSTADLFTAADTAMYEAKRTKVGVRIYDPGMRGSSRSRLRLMRDVRSAIEQGTPSLAYQPIVRADTLGLHGVEALLRWDHPTLGPIPPDDALNLADAVGMTAELTDHIVATISDDLATWHRVSGRQLPVAVNLSAKQLVHIDPEAVLGQLLAGPVTDGQLTIEVTETSMLGDLAAAARVLDVFRSAGCRIAIDDFGTGYASIGYLRQLPLDQLKIDREFIAGLRPSTVASSFAGVIQGLATTLRLHTIAEGVETAEQLASVRLLGCELVQGYHVSPALPMADLLAWASTERLVSGRA